jgi:hypothetical protein
VASGDYQESEYGHPAQLISSLTQDLEDVNMRLTRSEKQKEDIIREL